MLMQILVVALVLAALKHQEFLEDVDSFENSPKLTEREVAVRDFIHHSLRQNWEPDEFGVCVAGNRFCNETTLPTCSDDFSGDTVFFQPLTNCAWPAYRPRVMRPQQVSWKAKPKDDSDKLSPPPSSSSPTSSSPTAASGMGEDRSEADSTTERSHTNSDGDRVHQFLAFILALPQHEPSLQLLEAASIVAPLFTNVTTVVGNALEFTEFIHQYGIKGFPKLLFFKYGLLKARFSTGGRVTKLALDGLPEEEFEASQLDIDFSGGYTPEVLAIFYARNSRNLPSAKPAPYSLRSAGWRGSQNNLREVMSEIHNSKSYKNGDKPSFRESFQKRKRRMSFVQPPARQGNGTFVTAGYEKIYTTLRLPPKVRNWWLKRFPRTFEPGLAIYGPETVVDLDFWVTMLGALWTLWRLYHLVLTALGLPSSLQVVPLL